MKTVSIGLVGLGGYAQTHLLSLRTLQMTRGCRIVAACDPFADRQLATVAALKAEGTEIYSDLDKMLARDDIDAVTIATPINLHAPQSQAAFAAGKSVYLEKPPCPTLEELDGMIAARNASPDQLTARVGFQMQTSGAMRWVKQQLVAGTWGALKTISASVCWPRDDGYYGRSPWAATWRQNGAPVFDGPATNALSHVVFAALFLGGETEDAVAAPQRVRGSLMKARPVESYDSSLMEAELSGGSQIRLAFTHATEFTTAAAVFIDCEKARIRLSWDNEVTVTPRGGEAEHLKFQQSMHLTAMHDFLRSITTEERGLLPTLEDARGYVQLTCGALQSSAAMHPGGAGTFSGVRETAEGRERLYVVDSLNEQMAAFENDADAELPIFGIDSCPWIPAEEIAPSLAV